MAIDNSIVLQSDSAVIAGVLILLTVTYILAPKSEREVVGAYAVTTATKVSQVAIFAIVFFSGSAILVILGGMLSYDVGLYPISQTSLFPYVLWINSAGKIAMIAGFGALAIGIVRVLWFWARRKYTKHQPTV